jgi:cytochrome P450
MLQDLSFSTALTSIIPILSLAILIYIHYHLFLHPLSKLPYAHWTVPFTSSYITKARNQFRESRSIAALHAKHGPIVRLGPKEVSVASLAGVKTVYVTSGGFERTEWFEEFKNYDGTPNLVTMDLVGKGPGAHAKRKKLVSRIWNKSFLLQSSNFAALCDDICLERLLPILESGGEGVDIFEIGCALGAEFISTFEFGTGNGMDIVRVGREKERKHYLELGKRKLRGLEGKEKATKELERQCLVMCREAERSMVTANKGEESASKFPVVYNHLLVSLSASETSSSPREIELLMASELLDNIEAGREGIGISLTYATHELCLHSSVQSALRNELRTLSLAFASSQSQKLSSSDLRDLDRLPFLESIVTETLRLRMPAPGPQRRKLPKEGAVIEGHFIPAGATIHSSPYIMNRNEDAFPEPDIWRPERWLKKGDVDGELERGADRRWLLSFGMGGRMCLGNHFSTLVLKVVLAAIYLNFETFIVDDEGIEQIDDMMATPKSDKLILGFKRIEV